MMTHLLESPMKPSKQHRLTDNLIFYIYVYVYLAKAHTNPKSVIF